MSAYNSRYLLLLSLDDELVEDFRGTVSSACAMPLV
jgi:hypothetical protein